MSVRVSSENTHTDLVKGVLPDRRAALLALTSAIYAASILSPRLRDTEIFTSALFTVTLPVLAGAMTVVAVLYACYGKVQVEYKGTKLSLESLPERDARDRLSDTWKMEDTQ